MTTEQKIHEAFEKHFPATHNSKSITDGEKFFFREGYLALLNELKPVGEWNGELFYRLPKGVTRGH